MRMLRGNTEIAFELTFDIEELSNIRFCYPILISLVGPQAYFWSSNAHRRNPIN
jgi:hypothetical protein